MENDAAASILFENIVLMRYVDVAGINLRQIGVLKLRENSYDAANHVLLISDQGMSIDGPVPPIVPPILNR
jgi:circadian clock protein KaiC